MPACISSARRYWTALTGCPSRSATRLRRCSAGEPPAPDRFLVGLATLTLLAEAAEQQPLVCIVDDVQWLDQASAQILGFVARRLLAERVAVVCAARTGGDDVLAGLPELSIRGLDDRDARALLLDSVPGPLDARVCDQVVAESHGNPLALLELPRTWDVADLAGGFGFPSNEPVAGRIEQSYVRRLKQLPSDTRLLVLAAAAEPLGNPVRLQQAAEMLGIDLAAAGPAQDGGLLELGGRVEFAHPLVRSAAYRSAAADDRRRVHRALAEATAAETDPDRRAWHRARATLGPDEEVAAELERSAGRAQARGGIAAAAAFLQRSAELTLDPARRAERALAAAQVSFQAGAFDGHAAAIPTLQRAAKALADLPVADLLRWGWMAQSASMTVWDDEGWRATCARNVRLVRDAGALAELPIHLSGLGMARSWAGDLAGAAAIAAEADSVAAATGSRSAPEAMLRLWALQGREAEAAAVIEQAVAVGPGVAIYAHWAAAVLYNGLARYEKAAEAARQATSNTFDYFVSAWGLPELIEAAARAGNSGLARDALERLAKVTQACGTDVALGIEARSRALLNYGTPADDQYREAIERLGRTRLRPELARAHLLYGEWLRREGRRADAREQLRAAHEMFTSFGMEAFAERTGRELAATGEKARKRSPETREELTPQEEQIARLARDGLSNPEIGAQLFVSARTVEWHLRNVFAKLGIASRRQLRTALPEDGRLGGGA